MIEIRVGDTIVRATALPDGRITIDERSFAIDVLTPGMYRVADDERTYVVAVAGPPDNRWVWVDGVVAQLEIVDAGQGARRRSMRGTGQLAAPMPATVVKVLVKEGDTVKVGDTVLVLEAMKMELPVRSPRDGRVRAIKCQAGELVQPGRDLVELE